MTKISEQKIKRIKENILAHLFNISPKTNFISNISQELARDEEFIKRLLIEMQDQGLVVGVKKNSQGTEYKKRIRWRLNDKTYKAYRNLHENNAREQQTI